MPEPKSPFKRVRRHFDFNELKRVCEMHETEFAHAYDMGLTHTPGSKYFDADYAPFYLFKDNGADILAVAHLDTVVDHGTRSAGLLDTAAGPVVYSGALDDRLGAYTILELLPKLGIKVDVLLTTGEEQGQSTAADFKTDKDYHWMIEFDRGGTDVVMYQYEDDECIDLVEEVDARVGSGSFSDIAFLDHLEIKGFNWGVGYRDYHGPRSHAYLEDYWMMIGQFVKFHAANAATYLPHEDRLSRYRRGGGGIFSSLWSEDDYHEANGRSPWDDGPTDEDIIDLTDEDVASDDFNVVNERLLAIEAADKVERDERVGA